MTKRKLWNQLTKMNQGKSKSKNYDVAETLNDLIEVIAKEFVKNGGQSKTLWLIEDEAEKAVDKIMKNTRQIRGRAISQTVHDFFIDKPKTKRKK